MARRVGWVGLAVGLAALGAGLVLTIGSAIAAGDWWVAAQPWIGLGLGLLVPGLAVTAVFAIMLDAAEPLGWWRVLAVPPAFLVGAFWASVTVLGVPTGGPGGPAHDVAALLYSLPEWLIGLVVLTLLLLLPLAIVRPWRGEAPPAG
jgi:hypothetical protein